MDYEEIKWGCDDALRELEDMFVFHEGEAPTDLKPHVNQVLVAVDYLQGSIQDLLDAIGEQTSQE